MGNKFILGQEDGTVAGGNARGEGAVDLQSVRAAANQVAAGNYSVALGTNNRTVSPNTIAIGNGNTASGFFGVAIGNGCSTGDTGTIAMGTSNSSGAEYGVVSGGQSNIGNGRWAVIGGGLSNNQGSQYGTISGGQSNVASTNSHATVVGGQSNTASGQHSIVGGNGSTASGIWAVALGYQNGATNTATFATGREAIANSAGAIAMGNNNPVATATNAIAIGSSSRAEGVNSVALGASSYSTMYNQFSTLGGGIGQASDLKAHSTTDLLSGGGIVLTLDGTGVTNLIIPSGLNRVWNVVASWTAVVTAITGTATGVSVGDVATECNLFAFKKIAGISSIVGTVTSVASHNDASMATAAMGYTAGASQQLIPTFSAPIFVGGGSLTIRVVLKLMLTEVSY
jgi:hypothetical protein